MDNLFDTGDFIKISGNTPSLKNSKTFTTLKNGRTVLLPSKTVSNYYKNNEYQYQINKAKFLKMIKDKPLPLKVGFYFVRDSKRKFDYINAAQVVQDLMVKHGWIEDDNCDFIIPVFDGYEVDKDDPCVKITIK